MKRNERHSRKELPKLKSPTELYQHHMFFGTYRMPGEEMDDLLVGYVRDPPARHVIVARNGQVRHEYFCFEGNV